MATLIEKDVLLEYVSGGIAEIRGKEPEDIKNKELLKDIRNYLYINSHENIDYKKMVEKIKNIRNQYREYQADMGGVISGTTFLGQELLYDWSVSGVKKAFLERPGLFAGAMLIFLSVLISVLIGIWMVMSEGAESFNQPIQPIGKWNVSNVESIVDETKDLICNNHTNVRVIG